MATARIKMTRIPVTSALLSPDPKCAIANSFKGTGVWLITTSPAASTGLPSGPVSPATSWATPSATATASTPDSGPGSAPVSRPRQVVNRRLALTFRIRGHGGDGLGQPSNTFAADSGLPAPVRRRCAYEWET